ncbi:MAG: hypothetical protein KZQ93_12760 [Candidatus Thiodiazotropha sp. (ex Monitilora ramsayi)]|nr:hypothetical protein [Candidatus Thiodiazotropha sp. (ex Monitilora ramsayi)]
MDIVILVLAGIGFYSVIYFLGKLSEDRKVKRMRKAVPELTKNMNDEQVLKLIESMERPH